MYVKSLRVTGVLLVANFDPSQTAFGKECVPSEPNTLLMDTEAGVAIQLPEFGLKQQFFKIELDPRAARMQICKGKCIIPHDVKEEVFVDRSI